MGQDKDFLSSKLSEVPHCRNPLFIEAWGRTAGAGIPCDSKPSRIVFSRGRGGVSPPIPLSTIVDTKQTLFIATFSKKTHLKGVQYFIFIKQNRTFVNTSDAFLSLFHLFPLTPDKNMAYCLLFTHKKPISVPSSSSSTKTHKKSPSPKIIPKRSVKKQPRRGSTEGESKRSALGGHSCPPIALNQTSRRQCASF